MVVTVLLLRLCVWVHSIGNPKEVMPCSYRGIFLLPHLTSNCLFPKERIIHELMDFTGPNTGHTSQYCTALSLLTLAQASIQMRLFRVPAGNFLWCSGCLGLAVLVHRWEFWLRSLLHFPALSSFESTLASHSR